MLLLKNNLTLFIILLTLVFLWLASEILLPFVVGILLAYILNPIVIKLKDLGLGHLISVIITLLLSLCFFFGSFIFFIPLCIEQFSSIIVKLPLMYDKIIFLIDNNFDNFSNNKDYLNSIKNILYTKSEELISVLINIFSVVFGKGKAIINFIGLMIITPIVTCYILYDWAKIIKYIQNKIPKNNKTYIDYKVLQVDKVLSSFFRGQLIVSFILILFYSILLTVINIEGSISIGIMIGILSFIPYLGTVIGLIMTILFTLVQYSTLTIFIYILVIFVIGQFIESYVLVPKYISKNVGLHPVVGMFALLAGGAAFGLIGVLFAIPLTAILTVLFLENKSKN